MKNIQNLFSKKEKSYEDFLEDVKNRHKKLIEDGLHFCENLHTYSMDVVKEELGLDEELIQSLIDDYIQQIFMTLPELKNMLAVMKKQQGSEIEFTPFRDLVHKNLGVARNLRIKDIEEVLSAIMKSEDLDFIQRALDYLEVCTILLKPEYAYNFLYNKN